MGVRQGSGGDGGSGGSNGGEGEMSGLWESEGIARHRHRRHRRRHGHDHQRRIHALDELSVPLGRDGGGDDDDDDVNASDEATRKMGDDE